MKLSDLNKTNAMLLNRLYTKVFGKSMADAKVDTLDWVNTHKERINNVLSTVESPQTLKGYHTAINAVSKVNNAPSNPAKSPKDRTKYYSEYKKKYENDEEWMKFQRALSYLVKANMPADKATKRNSIKEPSQNAIEKYDLYLHKGTWYSSVVDLYCMKHGKCKKNKN